jgi:glycosyltransferase involved in cell wall biosynthesis
MSPKLSILTPVFNGEHYIENCIRNVIDQNCPLLEHVILDGGSTDSTLSIIQHYAEKNSHIRWISEEDSGQSDAMNKGIRLAKGEIIGFLNVDDFYEEGILNRIIEIFTSLPQPSLLVGNCNVWRSDKTLLFVNRPSKLTLFDLVCGKPFPVNPSAYFYHKSLHDIIGPYDVNDTHSMDLDFLLRAVQYAHVVYRDEIWGNFMMVRGSKTLDESERDITFFRMKEVLKRYRKNLNFPQRIFSGVYFTILEIGRFSLHTLRKFNINPKFLNERIRH